MLSFLFVTFSYYLTLLSDYSSSYLLLLLYFSIFSIWVDYFFVDTYFCYKDLLLWLIFDDSYFIDYFFAIFGCYSFNTAWRLVFPYFNSGFDSGIEFKLSWVWTLFKFGITGWDYTWESLLRFVYDWTGLSLGYYGLPPDGPLIFMPPKSVFFIFFINDQILSLLS